MHLKTPKHQQQKSKLLKIRAYFLQKVKLFNKMYLPKSIFQTCSMVKKNFVGQKENKEEFFQKLKFNFEKSIFFQFEPLKN